MLACQPPSVLAFLPSCLTASPPVFLPAWMLWCLVTGSFPFLSPSWPAIACYCCTSACLLPHQYHDFLSFCLLVPPGCLPTCMPACLPVPLPACPAYLSAYQSAWLPSHKAALQSTSHSPLPRIPAPMPVFSLAFLLPAYLACFKLAWTYPFVEEVDILVHANFNSVMIILLYLRGFGVIYSPVIFSYRPHSYAIFFCTTYTPILHSYFSYPSIFFVKLIYLLNSTFSILESATICHSVKS